MVHHDQRPKHPAGSEILQGGVGVIERIATGKQGFQDLNLILDHLMDSRHISICKAGAPPTTRDNFASDQIMGRESDQLAIGRM
ncbi:uncharacterized protein METZ01_LOCUS495452 [marine metagenome]|uniref:Uncharacterized protein n=1 Tax=marine metagenome TaxID=408172 RepID=A0A383DFF9_9ZZZZ